MTSPDFSALSSKVKERLSYGVRINPSRDWLVLLSLAAIIFAVVVVWNAWAYDTVVQGGSIGAAQTSVPPLFNQSSLDTITTIFAQRAAEETKYQNGTYTFTDPSR